MDVLFTCIARPFIAWVFHKYSQAETRPAAGASLAPKAGNSLMKQLAIPLSNQKTVAKWLVISGKPDVKLTPGRLLIAQ